MDNSLDSNRNEDFHFEYLNQFKDSLKSVPMTTENIIKAIKEFKGADKNLKTTYKTIKLYNKIKQN